MKQSRIKGVHVRKRPRYKTGLPSIPVPNRLDREFTIDAANRAWVTDIRYIRTWQGRLYLAAVMDLYSRRIVGWSMKTSLRRDIVPDAILMAVRWCRLGRNVLVHSDQGTQYGSDDWHRFCREHNLEPSMSRRGSCWGDAVAESFFGSLKRERVKRRKYRTHDEARADVFDYTETFYNPRRRQSRGVRECHKCGMIGVYETKGSSEFRLR